MFTQLKLADDIYRHLLYFTNFQQDIFWNKKVILHELLQEFGHVVWLIHGFKGVFYNEILFVRVNDRNKLYRFRMRQTRFTYIRN